MADETTPVQQDDQATGQAAAPASPEQQVQPTPTPSQQQQTAPPQGQDWHTRYNGLQQVHQTTVQELRQVQQQLAQQQQHAGTLEQQLTDLQDTQSQLTQTQQEAAQQLTAAQQENQFWRLVSSDQYRSLLPFAEFIQRSPDAEQQEQILQGMLARMGGTVQEQATQIVQNQLAGAVPGATMPISQAMPQTPSYEEVMEHVLDDTLAREHPEEWQRWYDIYQNHPEMNYESLGLGPWQDPTPNHYQTRRQAVVQEGRQRTTPQAVEPTTGVVPGSPWNGN